MGQGGSSVADAQTVLQQCGVVHIHGAVATEVLEAAGAAWKELHNQRRYGEFEIDSLMGRPLAAGRDEVVVPDVAPFNSSELLAPAKVLELAAAYFRSRPFFDLATLIVAEPGKARRQHLHKDVNHRGAHLHVLQPLTPVKSDMGLTRFCPCTHGSFHADTPEGRVIHRYFGAKAKCAELSNFSYAFLPNIGDITVYDGSIFHQGLENVGKMERTFLDLSFAASATLITQRGYLEDSFELGKMSHRQRDMVRHEVSKLRLSIDSRAA